MVYIRTKIVKGIEYAYLVKSVWNPKYGMSKQETVKYLGRTSNISQDDLPEEYRNDSKIMAFISSHSMEERKENKKLVSKLQGEMIKMLLNADFKGIVSSYKTYSHSGRLSDFYDKILKPVLYKIGELWKENKISIADEHVASNLVNDLIRTITIENTNTTRNDVKILICAPDGEWHEIGANMIESILLEKGYKVFNLLPSATSESIVRYVQNVTPDVILISATLEENIPAVQRLVKKIKTKYSIPIVIGGQAINKTKTKLDATIIQNASLDETMKIIKSVIRTRS